MRAELTRLRSLLGADLLDSRPYRLRREVTCDWRTVEQHLAAGRMADAAKAYRGPLLPQSDAPGIVERRERLERQMRAAVLASRQLDLMVSWTRSRWGADDLDMWAQQARLLPSTSPLGPIAAAEVARLQPRTRRAHGHPDRAAGRCAAAADAPTVQRRRNVRAPNFPCNVLATVAGVTSHGGRP